MNNINLLQTIAKLCDKKTLSINERKIDETAKQNAKLNGYNVVGNFNFTTNDIIPKSDVFQYQRMQNVLPLSQKDSNISFVRDNVRFLENCTTSFIYPFVDFGQISWGYPSVDSATLTTKKLSPYRLSVPLELSLTLLRSNDENLQIDFVNNMMGAIYEKLFQTVFSSNVGASDIAPEGLINKVGFTNISSVETLSNMAANVDKNTDNGIYLISPTAKQYINTLDASIFANGKLLNSNYMCTNLVENDYICYVDLGKIAVAEFGVFSVTIDNYTKMSEGKVKLIVDGYFDFDIASEKFISVGKI